MTEKTLTTENIKPAIDALRGELAPWPVVAMKQDRLNDTQKSAVNSGITSGLVAQIIANTAAIRALESAITGTGLRPLVVASLPAVGTTGILYIVPVTTYDPDTDADVVNYSNEYIWIPVEAGTASEGHYEQVGQTGIVINNGQLTITVNGTSVGTFTANQSGDTTAAITVPTNADYVDRTTAQTVAGVKTFSDGIVSNVTGNVTGDLTGTASRAIADEDGTSIKSGYVNVAGNQTVTGSKDWSSLQTFSYGRLRIKSLSQEIGVTPATSIIQYLEFADKNNVQHGKVGLWDYAGGASEIQMSITDKYNNGVKDPAGTSDTAFFSFGFKSNSNKFITFSGQVDNSVIPLATNAYSLGSSSYQWSSVYAQTYYYNGTQWGLDQANVWTGSNTFNSNIKEQLNYTIGETPATDSVKAIQFVSSSGSELINVSGRALTSGVNIIQISAGDRFTNGVKSPTGTVRQCVLQIGTRGNGDRFLYTDGVWRNSLIPYNEANVSLGIFTNQWNNLYAKNYYYNGTAWGLDKANTWTNTQTYSTDSYGRMIWLKNTGLDLSVNGNTGLSNAYQHMISWVDKNNAIYSSIQSWTASSENTLVLRSYYRTDANTIRDLSVRFTSTATNKVIYPETNADTELGTSTNKWKTLNGVNPGALSLPDASAKVQIDTPASWVWDGTTENSYVAPITGWLSIGSNQATYVRLFNSMSLMGSVVRSPTASDMRTYIPMVAGDTILISGITSSSFLIRIYPCLGNV